MASITGMVFYRSICYLLSDMLRVTIILSFNFIGQCTLCVHDTIALLQMKYLITFLQSYGPQQSGPEPR